MLIADHDYDVRKFDAKKFLAAPLNSGGTFASTYDGVGYCYCIKGAYGLAVGHVPMKVDDALVFSELTGNQEFSHNRLNGWKREHIIERILDRAERILLGHSKKSFKAIYRGPNPSPQYAKLFVLRALRKYGFIPKEIGHAETEIKREKVLELATK